MRTTSINKIEEIINNEIERETRKQETRITDAILERVNRRSTVIYSPTGNELFKSLTGEKFIRAYELRHRLYCKNNEALRIIELIGEILD